jgi:hypothetical protein
MTRKLSDRQIGQAMRRAYANVSSWSGMDVADGYKKVSLIRGNSADVLRRMLGRRGLCGISRGSVDLCMIDGNHNALSVLDDA